MSQRATQRLGLHSVSEEQSRNEKKTANIHSDVQYKRFVRLCKTN